MERNFEIKPMTYRMLNGVFTIDDCQCVAEECIAGFVPEYDLDVIEQLELFKEAA